MDQVHQSFKEFVTTVNKWMGHKCLGWEPQNIVVEHADTGNAEGLLTLLGPKARHLTIGVPDEAERTQFLPFEHNFRKNGPFNYEHQVAGKFAPEHIFQKSRYHLIIDCGSANTLDNGQLDHLFQ